MPGVAPFKVRADGTILLPNNLRGRWQIVDPARYIYRIAWPEIQDNAVLSSDGRILNEASEWFVVSAVRETPGPGIVGNWRWPNGALIIIRADGTFSAGALAGTWRLVDAEQRAFVLTWPGPITTMSMSADGQRVAYFDTFGNQGAAARVAGCSPD